MILDSVSALRSSSFYISYRALLDLDWPRACYNMEFYLSPPKIKVDHNIQVESVTFDLGTWGKIIIKFCSSIL